MRAQGEWQLICETGLALLRHRAGRICTSLAPFVRQLCTPGQRAQVRSVALAIKASHEFMETVRSGT